MRSLTPLKIAGVLGSLSIVSFAALRSSNTPYTPYTDAILEIDSDSLTDCLQPAASNVQDASLTPAFRGVELQGTTRSGSMIGMNFAGNPFEPGQSQCGSGQSPIRLDTGTFPVQEVDISLPSLGPSWIIGHSYNARQEDCSTGYRNSDPEQGVNWFQDSRPELVFYDSMDDAKDTLLLIYRADAFLEFKRTGVSSGTFKATNGAGGVIAEAASGAVNTYTLTDMAGTQYTFFAYNTAKSGANGQLWKIEDSAGNTAYVGDKDSASTAVSSGFDGGGSVEFAYDGSGRRFQYFYSSASGVKRLIKVEAAIPDGLSWIVVATVEYDYYSGAAGDGDKGALKLVTITTPQTDSSVEVIRKRYYRYWEGSYDATTNPGYPFALKYIVDYEGTRRQDWKDGIFDEDFLTETDANLEAYASAYFEYDSEHRISKAWLNGDCGCSSTPDGLHEYTYETSGYTNTPGYDVGWATRTVVKRPDGTYLTQYFDEAGQALTRVITDSDPAGSPTRTWVTDTVRDSAGLISAVYSPASVTAYSHGPTVSVTYSSGEGLITEYTRETTGTRTGYVLDQKHREGTGNPLGFERSWEYGEAQLNAGTIKVVRPYQSKVTVYTDDGSALSAIDTDYAYTFHTGTLAIETITTTLPIVPTSENGSGSGSIVERAHFRTDGLVDFEVAADLVVTYSDYTDGQLTKRIVDADTSDSDVTGGAPYPSFESQGDELHKKVEYVYDNRGRLSTRDRYRGTTADTAKWYYSRLADHGEVVLSFPKASGSTHYGPVGYRVYGHHGSAIVEGRIALTGGTSTAALTLFVDESEDNPIEAIDKGSVCRLTLNSYNEAGSRIRQRREYHLIPGTGLGTAGTNYDLTQLGYDDMGRRNRIVDPTGTITRTKHDDLGRPVSMHIGTDDSDFDDPSPTTHDLVKMEEFEYDDGNDGGNSFMTKMTSFVEDGATGQRVTQYAYDYRGRRLLELNPAAPHRSFEYDNLGRIIKQGRYSAASISGTGIPTPSAPTVAANRLALSSTYFDDRGRIWKSLSHEIDQADGSDDDSLETLYWYDEVGRQVKMDGEQLTKTFYDRLGRSTHEFVLANDDDAANDFDDVQDVAGDKVLEEYQSVYDADDDTVILTARIDRHYDDLVASPTTGALDTNADGNTEVYTSADIKGRIQITAHWYDELDRRTDTVRYGTNGGVTFTRATSAPTSSTDDALLSAYAFTDDGEIETITDPMDRVIKYEYDDLGRKLKEIKNYNGSISSGAPSGTADNRTVVWEYDDGLLKTITADVPSGTDQVTTYLYGVTKSDSPGASEFASNRLLREVQYPDKDSMDPDDVVRFAYNVLGEVMWREDQAGNEFELEYDGMGRVTENRVKTVATGFDSTVRRIETAYDGMGRRSSVTQYDSVTSGTALDQVGFEYTDWGHLAEFRQDVNSTIDDVSSDDEYNLVYDYEKWTVGRNTIRRAEIQYPHNTTYEYIYEGTGGRLDDDASRVTHIKRGLLNVATYEYNGRGQVVGTYYDQPDMQTHVHDGNQYFGLDNFNRVIESKWIKTAASSLDFVHEKVFYDRNSNTVRVEDLVHIDMNNGTDTSKFDVEYTMDGLDRLTKEHRGEWSGTAITSEQLEHNWTLDHLGNWNQTTLDRDNDGAYTTSVLGEFDEDRTHNAVNELTARDIDNDGTSDYTLVYDAVGNLTDDGDSPGTEFTYDPFGRLVKIEVSKTTVAEYRYNGLGYQISERLDDTEDGVVNSSDTWFHTVYDESWRALLVYRDGDTASSPKIEYVNHNAGDSGYGGSSHIDGIAYRRKDTSTDWNAAANGFDQKLYYCQNWRHDVVAVADFRGYVHEWVRYSAYGVPFGFPAGDDDVSGRTVASDITRIQNRVPVAQGGSGWAYSVLSDINLDGNITVDDKTAAQTTFLNVALGYGVLSSEDVGNRRGWGAAKLSDCPEGTFTMRHRTHHAGLGRWTTRDPVGYPSIPTLYEFTDSSPIRYLDPMGLSKVCQLSDEDCCEKAKEQHLSKHGQRAGVICCEGRKVPCDFKGVTPRGADVDTEGAEIHEWYHIAAGHSQDCPTSGNGSKQDGGVSGPLSFHWFAPGRQYEIDAYTYEIFFYLQYDCHSHAARLAHKYGGGHASFTLYLKRCKDARDKARKEAANALYHQYGELDDVPEGAKGDIVSNEQFEKDYGRSSRHEHRHSAEVYEHYPIGE